MGVGDARHEQFEGGRLWRPLTPAGAPGQRWARVSAALSDGTGPLPPGRALCAACATLLDAQGAAITVFGCDQARLGWVSDPRAGALEELQFTLGEGPALDAVDAGAVVSQADLADAGPAAWLAFGPAATARGVGAVFGFPLQVGAARLGALTVYRDRPGRLSFERNADGQTAAAVVTQVILAQQAAAKPGALGADDDAYRAEVHQAAGMISVQLGVGIIEALVRLRSHAYARDRPLGVVAADIVARRLRLER